MSSIHIDRDVIHSITLDKSGQKSFGVCVVRGEVKDSPNNRTTGIFIKSIVPNSPASMCGKLKIGDRILSLNGKDLRNATELGVIELIKNADARINLEIQTFPKIGDPNEDLKENGYKKNQNNISDSSIGTKIQPKTTEVIKNTTYQKSLKQRQYKYTDEDEEDTRDMTGRLRTEAGYEIDRSSAGNCKLNKQEMERDKEQEDEFGYTMSKIIKRYNLLKDLRKIEVNRPLNIDLGIALAGHSDRQKMASFIAGVNPNGLLVKFDIKPGDEILEVNGNVLQNRCHLNASVTFKSLAGEKLTLITARRKPNDEGMSVKPLKKFARIFDDTKFIFEQFPNARSVQVKKDGFLGIMIIYGKHVEVGSGIFISDLREGSNAIEAGIKVGDMLLAVNKDVVLESNYDEAVGFIKRAEGIITLIILTLKSEDTIKAEKESEEKAKIAEAEKPQDPTIAVIKPNKKILIEIKVAKKPLGIIVVGGKNNYVKNGCVITHIYPEGVVAGDSRLRVFDRIVELNNVPINCAESTTLKVHQLFNTIYETAITLQVYRADPIEVEKFEIVFSKKPGKDIGLSLAPNERGCTISEITSAGYADIENKLQRGDIVSKLNGESLENCSFEESFALFKTITGRISMEIIRPKPSSLTDAMKKN